MRFSFRVIFFTLIFCGGMAAFMVLQYGGTLMNDIAVRGARMIPHPTARVINAKCTRYYHLVSACSTEYDDRLVVPTPSKNFKARRELNYLIFDSVAGERVALLQPVNRPDIVTTSAGLAHLDNRVITLAVLVSLCAIGLFGVLLRAFAGRRTEEAFAAQATAPSGDRIDEMVARHQAKTINPATMGAAPGSNNIGFGRRGLAR